MPSSPFSWHGKNVLVTGAGVRLGRAIALAFARGGADVAVHYRGSRAGADSCAEAIRDLGRRAQLVQGDQAVPGEPERIVDEAVRALGGLDALVLSAGIFEKAPAEALDHARFLAMLETNLLGPFLLARAAVPHLRARRGAIITLLDVCGTTQVWKGYAHYAAAKAGLAALTKSLALEWAPEIRVNGVAPGSVLPPKATTQEEHASLAQRIPLGRKGEADDVARAVLFLAGEPFVTGQILAVDGGRTVNP